MTKNDTFTYASKFGHTYNCRFETGRYTNGNLELEMVIVEDEEPYSVCTVNPGFPIADGHLAIKDYSENEGMVSFLVSLGVIEEKPVDRISSGWVTIPVHKLTESGLELFKEEVR